MHKALTAAMLLVSATAPAAQADRNAASYPSRPIRIVVPFAAGGPSDVGARTLIRSGRMRALGVSTPNRFTGLPDVPTVAESGLPGFAVSFWMGALAPAATPRAIVDKLNAEMVKILRTPEVAERLSPMGLEILATTPDKFGRVIKADAAKWAKVVKEAGIKAD